MTVTNNVVAAAAEIVDAAARRGHRRQAAAGLAGWAAIGLTLAAVWTLLIYGIYTLIGAVR